MALHKFAVGDRVEFSPGRFDGNVPRGIYTVARLMPSETPIISTGLRIHETVTSASYGKASCGADERKADMAFKVNYNQQRAERDRAKAAKKEAKLREQEELTARRKAGLDMPDDAPAEAEVTPEKSDGAA